MITIALLFERCKATSVCLSKHESVIHFLWQWLTKNWTPNFACQKHSSTVLLMEFAVDYSVFDLSKNSQWFAQSFCLLWASRSFSGFELNVRLGQWSEEKLELWMDPCHWLIKLALLFSFPMFFDHEILQWQCKTIRGLKQGLL